MKHAACLSLCALLVACGTETGILVSTTRSEQTSDIDRLVYYVGEARPSSGDRYLVDREPEQDIMLDGRDLFDEPYRLLIRPGAERRTSIVVAAVGYRGAEVVAFGVTGRLAFLSDQVSEWELVLEPASGDTILVTDTGCLKWPTGDGDWMHVGRPGDLDCDGATDGDCDDTDPNVHPGAWEDCGNGIDDDCNGLVDRDDNADGDMDGVGKCEDCNDGDDQVHPGATEVCDGVDNNCDGACDDLFDGDGDGVSTCGSLIDSGQCIVIDEGKKDCDDADKDVNPLATEVCDGKDNDCSGHCDDDPSFDEDGDGYTDCSSMVGVCGTNDAWDDCEPQNGSIHPGAAEICDGIDNNCDDVLATEVPCLVTEGESCLQGTRDCNETGDDPVLGQCGAAADTVTFPAEECSDYAACEQSDAENAWGCYLDQLSGTTSGSCVVSYQIVGGSCPGTTVQISTGGTTCSWSIVGGTQQMGYRIGFVDGGSPATTTAECSPVLEISAVVPLGSTVIYIARVIDDVESVVRIEIEPAPVLTCGNTSGLSCDAWSAAP